MKLKINKILDRGIANKERLWLKVLESTDLGMYMVLDTTYTSQNQISNLLRHTFWFESKVVNAGDSVVLYTKQGTPSVKINNNGSKTYFIYWGLEKTIWNKEGDCAVLLEINNWETSAYE